MLTLVEFTKLVYAMRAAQKDYFDQRTRSALARAKDLEARVDRTILQIAGEAAVQESFLEKVR